MISDIDLAQTKVFKTTTVMEAATADWSWSDGDSFFAAFFSVVDHVANPLVDVKVTFLPSNDDDGSTGVIVDAPMM